MHLPVSREERIRVIRSVFQYLMWVASRQLLHLLQPFGLTFPQFIVLAALVSHRQACAMRDLTHATFEDPPTMTGIIDRLLKMGLVKRGRSETDRRVVLVEATPAGIDLFNRINERDMQDALTAYAVLTDEDLTTLEKLLRTKLRMHVGRYRSLKDDELDAEIEKLNNFSGDPLYYAKLENEESP